jgi:hypothetical protein
MLKLQKKAFDQAIADVIETCDVFNDAYYATGGISTLVTFDAFMCHQRIPLEVMQDWRQTLAKCTCCRKHMSRRSNSQARKLTENTLQCVFDNANCKCPCRHFARILETACKQNEEEADI